MVAEMKQPDRTLVADLDPFMTAHGFKFIKSREAYFRKQKSGFDYFSWGSYPLATGEKWAEGYYEGHYGIGLRNDAISEIWDVLNLTYGADNRRYRPTVYRGVGSPSGQWFAFDPTRDRELCLRFDHLEEDVAETVGRIETMLEADGWSWYERYSDPVALSRDINNPVGAPKPHPLVNNSTQRPLVGVAAACVGEPDWVPELIDAWLAAIGEWDAQYADQRPPMAPDFKAKFALLTARARELGHPV